MIVPILILIPNFAPRNGRWNGAQDPAHGAGGGGGDSNTLDPPWAFGILWPFGESKRRLLGQKMTSRNTVQIDP